MTDFSATFEIADVSVRYEISYGSRTDESVTADAGEFVVSQASGDIDPLITSSDYNALDVAERDAALTRAAADRVRSELRDAARLYADELREIADRTADSDDAQRLLAGSKLLDLFARAAQALRVE